MHKILLCVGPGIGNTVMLLPVAQALESIGYNVQFLVHPHAVSALPVLRGYEYRIGTGTTEKVGMPILWKRCLNKSVSPDIVYADDMDLLKHHETQINMTIARKLGYQGDIPYPKLKHVRPKTNDTIAICPGCRPEPQWVKKKYPHLKELCEQLSAQHALTFLGLEQDSQNWMKDCGTNLCGILSLEKAIDWIAGTKATICIDNGLCHISAALSIPTNVLFGPTSPVKNKPLGPHVNIITNAVECSPCQLTPNWDTCTKYICMEQLTPEQIITKLKTGAADDNEKSSRSS